LSGPQRRRRASTLVVAVLLAVLGVVLMGRAAEARPDQTGGPCGTGFPFPPCTTLPGQGSSSTVDLTTTTEDEDVTTTTDDDRTDSTSDDDDDANEDDTDDTRGRTATTVEQVTTTVLRVSTSLDLLVPGDGTEGAESTTTSEKKLVTGDGGLTDNQLVVLIVTGLTVVGASVGLLTWRYWRATEPVEVPADPATREPHRAGPRTHRSVFLDP
jgi:hypothetical protein